MNWLYLKQGKPESSASQFTLKNPKKKHAVHRDAAIENTMEIINAINYRENIIGLLAAEKLPVDDLPALLENFIVAREDSKVSGVVGLEIYGQSALLRSLAVRPAYRDKGIAKELLNRIEEFAAAKGVRQLYLLTETAPDYFRRKGYIEI